MDDIIIFQPPEKTDFLISKTEQQIIYEKFEKNAYIPIHHFQAFMELENQIAQEDIYKENSNTTIISIIVKNILKYCIPIIKEIPENIIKTKVVDVFNKNTIKTQTEEYYNISLILDYPIECRVEYSDSKSSPSEQTVIIPSNTLFLIIGIIIPKKFIPIINKTEPNFFMALNPEELLLSGEYGLIEYYSNTYTQTRFPELIPKSNFKPKLYFSSDDDTRQKIKKISKYISYINEFYKRNYHMINTYLYSNLKNLNSSLLFDSQTLISNTYFSDIKYTTSIKSNGILKLMEGVLNSKSFINEYKNLFTFNVSNTDNIYNTIKMLGINNNHSKKIIENTELKKKYAELSKDYSKSKFKNMLEYAKKKSISINKFNIDNLIKLNDAQRKIVDLNYDKLEKYYNSLKKHTDDFTIVNSLYYAIDNNNKILIQEKLKEIDKIVKIPKNLTESTKYLQNKHKINLICPHIIAKAQKIVSVYKNDLVKSGEIRKFLINTFSLPYGVDGHFCKICGELLAETDEEEVLKYIQGKRVSFVTEIDPLKQKIWKEVVGILTTYVKFKELVNLKSIVNGITDTLRDEMSSIELNLIKIRTNTKDSIGILMNIYISIYTFAILVNMIINNYGKITFSVRQKTGGKSPLINVSSEKKLKKKPNVFDLQKHDEQSDLIENTPIKEFTKTEELNIYVKSIKKYDKLLYHNIITYVDKTLEYYKITPINDEVTFYKNNIDDSNPTINKNIQDSNVKSSNMTTVNLIDLKTDIEIKKYMIHNIMAYRKIFTNTLIQFLIQVFSDIKYNFIKNYYSFKPETEHDGFIYHIVPNSNKLSLLDTFKNICSTNIYFHNNIFNKNKVTKDFKHIMCKNTNVFTEIFTHMINSNTINLSLIDPIFNSSQLKNHLYNNNIYSLTEYSQIICRLKSIMNDVLTSALTHDTDIIWNIIKKFMHVYDNSKNKPRNIKLINKGGNLFKTKLNNFLNNTKNKNTILYKKYPNCVNMSDWDFAIEFDNTCNNNNYYKDCYKDVLYYINNLLKQYRNEFNTELNKYYDVALKSLKQFIKDSKLENIIDIGTSLKMDTKTFYVKNKKNNNNFNQFIMSDELNKYKKNDESIEKLDEYSQHTLFPEERKKYKAKITNVEIFENSIIDNTINAFDLIRINMRYNIQIKISDANSINFNALSELLDFSITKVGSNLDIFNKKIPKEIKYDCLICKDIQIPSYSIFWFILDIISIYIYKSNYDPKYDRLIDSIYLLFYTEKNMYKKLFSYKINDKTVIQWVTEMISFISLNSEKQKYEKDLDFFIKNKTGGNPLHMNKLQKFSGGEQKIKQSVLQNIINNALYLILKTKNISINNTLSLSHDSIKPILLKAYKWVKSLELSNTKEQINDEKSAKSNNLSKEYQMKYNNHIYEYLVYVRDMYEYYKNPDVLVFSKKNPKSVSSEYSIKTILGRDWPEIEKGFKDNISIYQDVIIPDLWSQSSSELSKYKYESFKNFIEYIKLKLYNENTIPMNHKLQEHIDKYKFLKDMENKFFNEQKIQRNRPFNNIILNEDLSVTMNDFRPSKIYIENYYDNNGIPHKFNIFVYQSINNKGIYIGPKKEYTNKDIISMLQTDIKKTNIFKYTFIVDKRCSVCNVLQSNVKNKTIEKSLKNISDIKDFYLYYENRCPKGELHNFIINVKENKCNKCGITENLFDTKNKEFYNKYIKIYEKEIIEKNKLERNNISSLFIKKSNKTETPIKKYPEWVINNASLLTLSKQFNIKYNILINLGLSSGVMYKLIEKERINPSATATPDMICSRNIYLYGYYLDIIHKYYLIKNYEIASFIPYTLKLILEKNKIRELNKKLPDLDKTILIKYDYYKFTLSNKYLSNFLLYIISNTLLTIYNNLKKNQVVVANELVLYIINEIIANDKMLSLPDITKFVIPGFKDELNDNFEALNISDDDDDNFTGYTSPTESIGEIDDLVDNEPDDNFSVADMDIEMNEENLEMHHDM